MQSNGWVSGLRSRGLNRAQPRLHFDLYVHVHRQLGLDGRARREVRREMAAIGFVELREQRQVRQQHRHAHHVF
ncbi:hypothetical protein G6F61_015164 [Rhizopus arrhizus]|nr:hypothetical protein G6F61_015164 [Rhizopus arrhizus]